MLLRHQVDGAVLDVGCGEGVLRSHLPASGRYVGIEPSKLAWARAKLDCPDCNIYHATAEDFTAEGGFSAVVFNEMLYYSKDPVALLKKYARTLSPGGMILCSIYQKRGDWTSRVSALFEGKAYWDNASCTRLIERYMDRCGWSMIEERNVPVPSEDRAWLIWLVRP